MGNETWLLLIKHGREIPIVRLCIYSRPSRADMMQYSRTTRILLCKGSPITEKVVMLHDGFTAPSVPFASYPFYPLADPPWLQP